MKMALIKFSIGALFIFSFCAEVYSQTGKRAEKIVEPTIKESLKQIILNGDVALRSAKYCARGNASEDTKTILDFLIEVLSFQAEPETNNSIEFSFKQERGRKNEILWLCDLSFRGGDEESPSSNGFRFKMRNSDRKLLRDSLMCIGTG